MTKQRGKKGAYTEKAAPVDAVQMAGAEEAAPLGYPAITGPIFGFGADSSVPRAFSAADIADWNRGAELHEERQMLERQRRAVEAHEPTSAAKVLEKVQTLEAIEKCIQDVARRFTELDNHGRATPTAQSTPTVGFTGNELSEWFLISSLRHRLSHLGDNPNLLPARLALGGQGRSKAARFDPALLAVLLCEECAVSEDDDHSVMRLLGPAFDHCPELSVHRARFYALRDERLGTMAAPGPWPSVAGVAPRRRRKSAEKRGKARLAE